MILQVFIECQHRFVIIFLAVIRAWYVRNIDTDDFVVTNPFEASCQVPVILRYRKQITIIRSDMLLNYKVIFLSASHT